MITTTMARKAKKQNKNKNCDRLFYIDRSTAKIAASKLHIYYSKSKTTTYNIRCGVFESYFSK
jgi:hypothetical protein